MRQQIHHVVRIFLTTFTSLIFFSAIAQENEFMLSGKVMDSESGEALPFSNIILQELNQGTVTKMDGSFSLKYHTETKDSLTLICSFVGYQAIVQKITPQSTSMEFKLSKQTILGKEYVVSASRMSETVMEAPSEIQKINSKEVQSASSGDFYQSIGNLQGVDVVTSSMGLKTINTRGFNTTSPFRTVQYVDGIDNQAPGLNFPIGNLVGAADMDIDRIEIISGAASALYGPNAFQGVIDIRTKDPFTHPGISAKITGGNQDYFDGQLRWAKTFGKKNQMGIKVFGEYLSATDWLATDSITNRYGDLEAEVDLTKIVVEKQFDQSLTAEERDDFLALNTFLKFYPSAYPGKITVNTPGYMEQDLADPVTKSIKVGTGLYYKLNKNLQAEYLFKYGNGTAIYQGTNRYSINNINFFQNKIQLTGRNFFVKAYNTLEDAGDSYDIVFTGINISKQSIAEYAAEYLSQYFTTLDSLTNGYSNGADINDAEQSHAAALAVASSGFIQAGSNKFDSLHRVITNDPDLITGSKFVDRSNLTHIEGQYNFSFSDIDLISGASMRQYEPRSFGTIFSDTLLNPFDTLADGSNNLDGEYRDITVREFGAYVQGTKWLLDEKLKVIGSFRVDKNQNYPIQYSPRLSAIYKYKENAFRISAQQAFRAPTLQDQYLSLDLGPIQLEGNLNGVSNTYSLESVSDFFERYEAVDSNGTWVGEIDPSLLETKSYEAIKPEQVQSVELGYRGVIFKKLYTDVTFYYNLYKNFIGNARVYQMLNDSSVAGEESGVNALLSNNDNNPTYRLYQYPVNAEQDVSSYGLTIGLGYFLKKNYRVSANYTFAKLDTAGLSSDIIPGFNTPEHKVNIGLSNDNAWKGIGFGLNFKWVDEFYWQSSFADGLVPSYSFLDAQLSYELKDYYTTIRIGASNVLDQKRIEAFGSPTIGRFVYASLTLNLN
ncbi:MAG: TonB-dependent receptor [Flavobacteriales bacterium]|nr:TonB-dependent receptor [Flavobacteriales bacterium]